MSLIVEFKAALATVLEEQNNYYLKKGIPMPDERHSDIQYLIEVLRTRTYVIDLKHAFVERYEILWLPWYEKLFPLFDSTGLRAKLKPILFNKKYDDNQLKDEYLKELIVERQGKQGPSEAEKKLQAQVAKLEKQLVELSEKNELLHMENEKLRTINKKLRDENHQLKELLKKNNIEVDKVANSESEDEVDVDYLKPLDDLNEDCLYEANQLLRSELEKLKTELAEMKKTLEQFEEQNKRLLTSKDQLFRENLKLLQEKVGIAERNIKEIESTSINTTNSKPVNYRPSFF